MTAGDASADTSARRQPGVLRVLDPFDVAGKVVQSVLPQRTTPPLAHAAYYVALAALVAVEVVDLPVAVLLGVGHLMLRSHNPTLEEVAHALDAAG